MSLLLLLAIASFLDFESKDPWPPRIFFAAIFTECVVWSTAIAWSAVLRGDL